MSSAIDRLTIVHGIIEMTIRDPQKYEAKYHDTDLVLYQRQGHEWKPVARTGEYKPFNRNRGLQFGAH